MVIGIHTNRYNGIVVFSDCNGGIRELDKVNSVLDFFFF